MIETVNHIKQSLRHVYSAFFLLLALTACMEDSEMDYCKNHYRFHQQHSQTLAQLDIDLSAQGDVDARLSLPYEGWLDSDPDPERQVEALSFLLLQPANVYSLQTTRDCQSSPADVAAIDGVLHARYTSRCGVDNPLKQVDVEIFDAIAALDEVEVTINTAATSKHFAISRQCDAAIFRLKPPR